MKTTDAAINKVFSKVKPAFVIPVYKYEKPTEKNDTEYIVINSLPINADVMQKCRVNVNYHIKDKKPGILNEEKLVSGTAAIMAVIEVAEKGWIVEFESQEYHSEPQLNEHYSNIRLSVKIINT